MHHNDYNIRILLNGPWLDALADSLPPAYGVLTGMPPINLAVIVADFSQAEVRKEVADVMAKAPPMHAPV